MFRRAAFFILLAVLVEAIGIYVVDRWLGGWPTMLLLIAGALVGGWLTRKEGRKVWSDAQRQLEAGQMPGHSLLDGICVLAGGLLLIIPGFLSDLLGLALLLPFTRPLFRLWMYGWLANKVRSGSFRISGGPFRR